MASYSVPEQNLSLLQSRIEKLAKRAIKLGVTPPALVLGERSEKKVQRGEGELAYYRTYIAVELTGLDVVKLNGWTLAAVIDAQFSEEGVFAGNLLRVVPSAPPVPVAYRTAASFCDHCQVNRRRNKTIIVVSDAGEWKQVGTNCVKDFLGHASAEAYASWAEMIADAVDFAEDSEHEGFGGGSYIPRFGLDEVLPIAAAAIRLYGWTSRKVVDLYPGKITTASRVAEWIMGSKKIRDEFEFKLEPVSDADAKLAADTIEWLKGLATREGLNDYMHNLSILGQTQVVKASAFGIICAAIVSYAKEIEFEINRKKWDSRVSEFVGKVGERETFDNLTVVMIRSIESMYGVMTLYLFRDEAGNMLKWFSSNDMGWERNQVLKLVASVKAHEVYKDKKQTLITRAKVWEAPKPKVALTKEQKAAKKALKLARSVEFRCQEMNRRGCGPDTYDACQIMSEIVNAMEAEYDKLAIN